MTVPTVCVVTPGGVTVRRFAERDTTVARWTEFDRGGAHVALEQPGMLVEDVREFFAGL
ncbi:hypothetical protein [Streptosporangium lutulentum]|uniref:Uncharacterized protein n=1 Tax=Streptosporangium lutulentum TaxID=1461250 RepID=A0ABT9QHY0_9ACTN|nr:hypothetical protein [Streptosporangium lutulentum]MDP9846299.1 hypothetical protein [Streptosporangium lutulentum]